MRITVAMVAMSMRGLCMLIGDATAVVPKESHKPQAKHVKRRNEGGDYSDQPVDPASMRAGINLPEDFVFAEESGQRPESRDRKGRDRHGQERPRDVLLQAAHLAHVLLTADSVDHRARGEE